MSSQSTRIRSADRGSESRDKDEGKSVSSSYPGDRERRDKLDERIRHRESESTRKLASRKDSRQINELAKKLKLDPNQDQEKLMNEIRNKSRVTYLQSRVAKKLDIYEADLLDEKSLFSDVNLTKKEREDIEYQEKILTITKSTIKAGEEARRVKQYLLPESQELDEVEPDEEDNETNAEQKRWERMKFEEANLKLGPAKTTRIPRDNDISDFDLLLQDTDFIERVKRGDTFEDDIIDFRKIEKQERDRVRQQLEEQRKNLPVYKRKDELLQAIAENQIVIVQGATGCGKTTQMPQYLHEAGYTKTEMKHGEVKMVGCTQPRRVAAMSVAARVSKEVNSKLGHAVGYSIRFEDCTSEGTVIKYMTDGMLLREILDDPTLSKYSVMIVDEAHERTLHTDILLTLLKDVTRARSDFRLIISSATLDEQKFCDFFNQPPVFKIEGRLHKVEKYYTKDSQKVAIGNMTDACLRTVIQIHRTQEPGDILVFLPGQDEIDELQKDLESEVKRLGSKIGELLIRPIYANLPTDMQSRVFDPTPSGARKVVIATNIAETSITIDGIRHVVDPGYCKQNKFSHKTGMETLAVTRISKASADQRAGRAGRTAPGFCYRLYTMDEFNQFDENTQPEIQRLNLANVVLLLKTMKINDVVQFEYVDRPPTEVLLFAIEQLTSLGALDKLGELTHLGRRMAEFPLEPKMSKAIIVSESHKCSEEVLTIMSMLSVNGTIFFKPKDRIVHAEASRKSFFSESGDHLTLLKVYNDWASSGHSKQWCFEKFIQYKSMCRARDIRDQLEKLCDKVEVKLLSDDSDTMNIRKAILGGFFYNAARISREASSYRTIRNNQSVYIHRESSLHDALPRWVVFNEIKQTSKAFMRTISEIEPSWLVDVAPAFYSEEEIAELSKRRMPKIKKGKSRAELNPKYG